MSEVNLVFGHEYYWLTAAEHDTIHNYVAPGLCTFIEGPDGFWYLDIDTTLDPDLEDALLEFDCMHTTVYSRSTQPGGNQ